MSMKRKRSPERQLPGVPRLSQSDIEEMVMSKVRIALGELESTRKQQQQKMEELDRAEKNFEDKLKQMKARFNRVRKNGEGAMEYLRHLDSQRRIMLLQGSSLHSPVSSLPATPPAESVPPRPVISSRSLDSGDGFSDGRISVIENVSVKLESDQPKRKTVDGVWNGWRRRVSSFMDLTCEDMPDSPKLSFSEENNTLSPAVTNTRLEIIKIEKKEDDTFSNGLPESTPASCPPTPPPSVKVEPESPKPIKCEETPYDISELPVQQEEKKIAQETVNMSSSLQTESNTASNAPSKGANLPQAQKVLVRASSGLGDDWRRRLHPLPDRPFPAMLPAAAASMNSPQALSLKLRHAESADRPEGLYLHWNVKKEDPHAAPMDSYFIHVAQENQDGTFSHWAQIGHVRATTLPMGCHLSGFPGYRRLCFALVGKDKFERYGPYSQVESICPKSAQTNKKQ